jgi:UTP:GlnB (protein PII) uridylyltransferase
MPVVRPPRPPLRPRPLQINLHTVRINTLGDRAEDVFLISGAALSNSKTVLQLEQDLLQELSLQPATPALEPALR